MNNFSKRQGLVFVTFVIALLLGLIFSCEDSLAFVVPSEAASVHIMEPIDGSSIPGLASIRGIWTGDVAAVEVQISYSERGITRYLTASGFSITIPLWIRIDAGADPEWVASAGWSLNTQSVSWRDGTTYTVRARARDLSDNISETKVSSFTKVSQTGLSGTAITASLSAYMINPLDTVDVSGTLTCLPLSCGADLNGSQVKLTVISPSGEVLLMNTSVKDSSGGFEFPALSVFTEGGTYALYTSYYGASSLSPSVSSAVFLDVVYYYIVGLVSGYVLDAVTGLPVPSAAISIEGFDISPYIDGFYFTPVSPGTVVIKVTAPGYITYEESLFVAPADDIERNIALIPADRCGPVLSPDLVLHIPFLSYDNGTFYMALDLRYDPAAAGGVMFSVISARAVDMSTSPGCSIADLTTGLELRLNQLVYFSWLLSADFQYVPIQDGNIWFMLTGAEVIQ